MAATQATLVNGVTITLAATPTLLYTSPSSDQGTIISAFTITNSGGASIQYKTWVVPTGSSVSDAFLLVPSRILKTLKTDVPYEVVSHFMPPDSTLFVEADTALVANIRVSGVELSAS